MWAVDCYNCKQERERRRIKYIIKCFKGCKLQSIEVSDLKKVLYCKLVSLLLLKMHYEIARV